MNFLSAPSRNWIFIAIIVASLSPFGLAQQPPPGQPAQPPPGQNAAPAPGQEAQPAQRQQRSRIARGGAQKDADEERWLALEMET